MKLPYTKLIALILMLAVSLSFAMGEAKVQSKKTSKDEYTIKAVFLEVFTRFIEWPAINIISDKENFELCVIGDNPFGSRLDDYYKENQIKQRKVNLTKVDKLEDIKNCELLFISRNMRDKIPEIVAFAKKKGILTISDSKGFADMGIHINLFLKGNRVNFEINVGAIRDADFKVDLKLLENARIVDSSGGAR